MGPTESNPKLPDNQLILDLSEKKLSEIPFRFSKNSKLVRLVLCGNQIHELPKNIENIEELRFSRNEIKNISYSLAESIRSLRKIRYLDMSSNYLVAFPIDISEFLMLETLDLHENKLENVELHSQSLINLDLSENDIPTLKGIPESLQELNFSFNNLEVLECSFPKLTKFLCSLNRISSVSNKLHMPLIQHLDLSRNRISFLPDMRKSMPFLKYLDLSDNFLAEIPEAPLGLEVLLLKHNNISIIDQDIEEYSSLHILNLSHNCLSSCEYLPPNLSTLSIGNNYITYMKSFSLPFLKKLILSNNKLLSFPDVSFPIIEEFFCSENFIEEISATLFSDSIRIVNLSSNRIRTLPVQMFSLPNLEVLNISRNNIVSLPQIINNQNLILLDLSLNSIKDLPSVFPDSLQRLSVAACGIDSLPSSLTQSKLIELCAPRNNLTEIPFIGTLKTIILSLNKFSLFPNLPRGLTTIDMSCNYLTSLPTPFQFRLLVEADFSNNMITQFPSIIECPSLKYLRLSHNPMIDPPNFRMLPKLSSLSVDDTDIVLPSVPNVHELLTNQDKLFTSPSVKLIKRGAYSSFSEMRGSRPSMEDAIIVRDNIDNQISCFAIFDGHGGDRTSTFSAFKFVRFLSKNAEFSQKFIESIVEKLVTSIKENRFEDGSTMASVLLRGNEMISAHLGDARTIVVRNDGTIKFETHDHRPDIREEYERIQRLGGAVLDNRTSGTLAVSRSVGDFSIVGVGYQPDVKLISLDSDDRWIIIGCDGVFDVLSSSDCGEIATKCSTATEVAYCLRSLAFSMASSDNISVIAIDLEARNKYE